MTGWSSVTPSFLIDAIWTPGFVVCPTALSAQRASIPAFTPTSVSLSAGGGDCCGICENVLVTTT
jgi:hypothetical protein